MEGVAGGRLGGGRLKAPRDSHWAAIVLWYYLHQTHRVIQLYYKSSEKGNVMIFRMGNIVFESRLHEKRLVRFQNVTAAVEWVRLSELGRVDEEFAHDNFPKLVAKMKKLAGIH